ncbi:MAG: 6-carboxytetrahydropterin synthase [Ignavibacteriales bacterium]|nr:6-carboxytetrahydropterin synthase [Ignavibacteriales bacterium]
MKIAKEFRWEMGHRLSFHKGKCKNLHGHTYKLLLELSGDEDKNGMVIDYYDLEKMISPIIEKIDHSCMVSNKDVELKDALVKLNSKMVIVDFESTAENISKYILKEIAAIKLPQNVKSIKARIYETEFDYAEAEKNFE